MRETTVSLFSKEEMDYIENDKKFVDFIANELTRSISDRLIQVLETNGDIVIKKPVLRVSEYPPTHSIEYRKTVDWEPLIRCKDCIHNEGSDNEPWCNIYECIKSKDGFCDEGEMKGYDVEIH